MEGRVFPACNMVRGLLGADDELEGRMSRALAVALAGLVVGCQPVKSLDGDMFRDPTVMANRFALAGAAGEGPMGAHLLYINFEGDGGTLYAATTWPEDSRTNKSQIIRTYRGNVSMPMPKADFS